LLTICGLAVLGLLPATPALAGDPTNPVDCSKTPSAAECTITVGTPAQGGGSGGNGTGNGGGGSGTPDPACHYVKVNDLPPPPGQTAASGGWYMQVCGNAGSMLGTAPQWIAADNPQVDPAVLARQASADLPLPVPAIRLNPDPARNVVLVRVPVWLWVDQGSWGTRTATAAVPGVTVTATATPKSVRWDMGDGTTKTCRGPGTAWRPGTSGTAASPTCGYRFPHSSAGAPGEAFAMRATVTWKVTWTGGGTGGTLPDLTTTSVQAIQVADNQTIIGRS
jgi:hypothetical protein